MPSIIFMGTNDFASESLIALYKAKLNILAVVTQPDRQKGRGRKFSETEVKKTALSLNLPILQPENLKDEEFLRNIQNYQPDLFVVVAFSILPSRLLKKAKLGGINLHASLLPNYRGAAPINHALFNGEKQTGISIFFLNNQKVDSGNIIFQKSLMISEDDDFLSLYNKLKVLGAKYIPEVVESIFNNSYTTTPQNLKEKTYPLAPKIFTEDFKINWNQEASSIHNRIRGISPKPGAFTIFRNKRLKIIQSEIITPSLLLSSQKPGTIIDITSTGILISCRNEQNIKITKVQPEGKKIMETISFINGYHPAIGELFS